MNIKEYSGPTGQMLYKYPSGKRLFTTQNIVSSSDNIPQYHFRVFPGWLLASEEVKRNKV